MFFTYLRRELAGRRRQTAIIAIGMAPAIALVMIVNAVSTGVREAQDSVLESVYGVGTDLTVSQEPTPPDEGTAPGRFEFDADAGTTEGDSTEISDSRLMSGPGGSTFDVNSFSVLGIDPDASAVGPISAVELDEGRGLEASDTGTAVAVLDANYATSAELAVGDTIDVGGTDFEIVGTVTSTSADAETAANVYIPLDLAQELSGETGMVSDISVQAESADRIDAVQADLEEALPDATVSTQSDLAASVSGSLATASSLIANLGLWLSLAVLVAAFLIAILFTIQGVTRRTREFGMLKAIGWSNGRVVGQVAGESLVQGLIGGVAGLALGLVGIWVVNLIAPTLGGSAGTTGGPVMMAGPG